MLYEQSYGALLYFLAKGTRYFILIGAKRKNGVVEYGFPKGHPEPEDKGSILATILREIEEETGITRNMLIVDGFDESSQAFSLSYNFSREGKEIQKTSTYYALKIDNTMKEILPDHDLRMSQGFEEEVDEVRVVAEDQVGGLLSHENERRLFEEWMAGL